MAPRGGTAPFPSRGNTLVGSFWTKTTSAFHGGAEVISTAYAVRNRDRTGQLFAAAGRNLGSLCLLILAAAWAVQATPSPASAESGVEPQGEDSFERLAIEPDPTTSLDPDCPYLRLVVQSPHGLDEDYQKPLRELLATSLSRAGFVVVDSNDSHYWWTSSLVLDNGSESAWSTVVRAMPEIKGGGILFTTAYKEVDGKRVAFSGMHSLQLFDRNNARAAAMQISQEIARDLLPAVHRRCDKAVLAAIREADAALERVRNELTEEMDRVRSDRPAGSPNLKRLELEVQQTPERLVSVEAVTGRPPGQANATPQRNSPPASHSTAQ